MNAFEITLGILACFAALLALGKIKHSKNAKAKNVCHCCGQLLPSHLKDPKMEEKQNNNEQHT